MSVCVCKMEALQLCVIVLAVELAPGSLADLELMSRPQGGQEGKTTSCIFLASPYPVKFNFWSYMHERNLWRKKIKNGLQCELTKRLLFFFISVAQLLCIFFFFFFSLHAECFVSTITICAFVDFCNGLVGTAALMQH